MAHWGQFAPDRRQTRSASTKDPTHLPEPELGVQCHNDPMAMNGRVQESAEHLERLLEKADPVRDRDTIVWALGFLAALVRRLERRVPDLVDETTMRHKASEALDRAKEALDKASEGLETHRKHFTDLSKDPDSLEQIERELGGEEPGGAPVPARRKPGPKGLTGGAAVPFSEGSDVPM
jgi:hypothetical protein